MDARESLTINGAHTIPIQVRFKTDRIIYPLKLVAIQPDRDSVSAPLSFHYGNSAKQILGINDKRVDSLLSTPSSSIYPPLLTDLIPVKIDLFIRAKDKTEAKGFTTIYANREGKNYLTRIISYKPLT